MRKEPYASSPRVFWIFDNGLAHRGQASIDRLEGRWPNLRLIHLPVHSSCLNQIEIVFSIIQRKLLQPNGFDSTAQLARALNEFQCFYNEVAEPFEWSFTSSDLAELLDRLAHHEAGAGPCRVRRPNL
jgi:DDE superfamily endonuclease